MTMECDTHPDTLLEGRPQAIEMRAKKQHERRHLERTRTAGFFDSRKRGLGELDVAARAPGDELARFCPRELVHGALGKPAGGRDVSGAHLHDAAAMARAPEHLIGDAERVHDV